MLLKFGFWGSYSIWDPILPKPGGRGAGLGLPTGQGNLTSLRTAEGGKGGWREGGNGNGRMWKFLIIMMIMIIIEPLAKYVKKILCHLKLITPKRFLEFISITF